MPGLYLTGISDCQAKLLNNFGYTQISFISQVLGLIVHFFASIYFVVYLDLGILGTGYSSACSFFVTFFALIYFSLQQKEIQ
jgi:Na+-driven multidrug efflux pump